jgi:hypothetical protein
VTKNRGEWEGGTGSYISCSVDFPSLVHLPLLGGSYMYFIHPPVGSKATGGGRRATMMISTINFTKVIAVRHPILPLFVATAKYALVRGGWLEVTVYTTHSRR